MQTIEVTRSEFNNIIQKNLGIDNPVLLKSGVLGIISEYLTNIKFDTIQYYSKMFREMNVGLAQDFNSLLFHSTIYNTEISMATPPKFSVSLIINEINNDDVKNMIYDIEENSRFEDTTGIAFLIPNRIEIHQSSSLVEAYMYTKIDKVKLLVTKAPDPLSDGFIYLVHYTEALQLKRSFYKVIVPQYELGSTYKFNQNITDYKGVHSINAWLNTGNPINLNNIENKPIDSIHSIFNIERFGIKYYKFGSNKFDLDMFINLYSTNVTFETGDGRLGKHLSLNQEIIICIEETLGENGNLPNTSFLLEDVPSQIIYNNGSNNISVVSLNGVSIAGGSGGNNIDSVNDIRNKIFTKISYRNSLTSINDFELFFKYNNIKPFIDAKFLDARNFLFVFNVMINPITNQIIDSVSINKTEIEIARNPFYPTTTYDDREMISPFYYKFLSNNETELFIVNPAIYIPLTNTGGYSLDDQIQLSLRYDFSRNKSYFRLDNAKDSRTYKIKTNNFNFSLDYANNFIWEVNTLFTDEFCIIKKEIQELSIDVFEFDNKISNFVSYESIYQLISKQINYKYYKTQENASDIVVEPSGISLGYLDNELRSLLIEVSKILDPLQKEEIPYLLRIPYIDKRVYESLPFDTMFELLDKFFKVDTAVDKVSFNTRLSQCLYNTIKTEPKYSSSVFKIATNSKNKKDIFLNIFLDREVFEISNDFNSLDELKINLKIDIIEFFKQKIGFNIRFFESELENLIYEKYNTNSDYAYIKNVEILSPTMFIVNDSESIFYNIKNNMDLQSLIDFCPPFFHYDTDNIELQITF